MSQLTANPTTDRPLASARHLGASISVWHVLIAFACLAASFWALVSDGLPTLRSMVKSPAYFDTHPLLFDLRRAGYSADVAREHLAALGNFAISYYGDTYLALYDLVFPVLLLAFGILLVLYATNAAHPHALHVTPAVQRLLLAVPIALFVFDMGENLSLYQMLGMYPEVNGKLVEAASMFTQLKYLAGFIEAVMMVGLIVFLLHRHIDADARPVKS